MIAQGCYSYWFTRTLVHVFLDHADTCTCERRRLRRSHEEVTVR